MIGRTAQIARGLARDTQAREPWRATVSVVRGDGMLEVTPLDGSAGIQPLAVLEGGAYDPGDEVWVFPAGSGWIVAGKNKRAAGGYKLVDLDTPLFTRKSQSAADTPSTTNDSTLVDAIAHQVTLPVGLWMVTIGGGANFAHSASQVLDRRAQLVLADASVLNGTISGATMLTTREHYAVDFIFVDVPGGQLITAKLQYRGGTGTSGTSSCRAPHVTIIAERVS